VILPSSAYKGTPEGKSAAKKHKKIEIRKDFYRKRPLFPSNMMERAIFSFFIIYSCVFVLR